MRDVERGRVTSAGRAQLRLLYRYLAVQVDEKPAAQQRSNGHFVSWLLCCNVACLPPFNGFNLEEFDMAIILHFVNLVIWSSCV
jgi:hypothetical protein